MTRSHRPFAVVAFVALVALVAAVLLIGPLFLPRQEIARQDTESELAAPAAPRAEPPVYGPLPAPPDADAATLEIGGIARPRTDVEAVWDRTRIGNPPPAKSFQRQGVNLPLAVETHPSVRYVAEHRDDPRVTSAMFAPNAFDAEAFRRDPESYLTRIEPGRALQTADDPQAPFLKREGNFRRRLLQGETTPLVVKTLPNMPVTFYSAKLGQFDNRLSVITVQADAEGIARAPFTATAGTVGDIEIVAASPVSQGQARFLVQVQLPPPPVDVARTAPTAR